MDIPLSKYRLRTIEIDNNISNNNLTLLTLVDISTYINEINIMQQYIEDTLSLIKNTHEKLIKLQLTNNLLIEGLITKPLYTKNNTLKMELFDSNKSNIIKVNAITDIPETSLYWIESLQQFAINIGGMVLRGNIGNIYNSNRINRNSSIGNVIYCKHKNSCDSLLSGKVCKYYHDPVDLLNLKISGLINTIQLEQQRQPRNFINTSWIYTEYPEQHSNSNMRHFGSLDTLNHSIQLIKLQPSSRNNIKCKNYADQCIHDILVCYALYTNGLLQ